MGSGVLPVAHTGGGSGGGTSISLILSWLLCTLPHLYMYWPLTLGKAYLLTYPTIGTGVQPNTVVYHSLVQGLCTHGDLAKAEELVSEMMNKGIARPNKSLASSFLYHYSISGSIRRVGANPAYIRVSICQHISVCDNPAETIRCSCHPSF
ncbi:hypothetical protein VPH35_007321 [Triticum aestivum]|uniref:Restorer of fertility-like protein n=1 Tax=Triticum aestivum TaxID=4565 RepID=A0A7S5VAY2_WHEAT|nr:restorer of fertility-like protein [Triticum aestivum]QIP66528.1 restorer of fertility-like protein [Triticum aestivum]QIP66731.1 restorer of fertility-like protein [Triticum aestivum]QIP66829.1 restorer of fertility-like protein [Triticum aestivum]